MDLARAGRFLSGPSSPEFESKPLFSLAILFDLSKYLVCIFQNSAAPVWLPRKKRKIATQIKLSLSFTYLELSISQKTNSNSKILLSFSSKANHFYPNKKESNFSLFLFFFPFSLLCKFKK